MISAHFHISTSAHRHISTLIFFSLLLFASCNKFSAIESGFVNPPDSIRTGVYWYWITDNISKEGVIKDLQGMKRAGINRAFIAHVGDDAGYYPVGKIKLFSDEWWDILHTALKTAGELDIEIGMFNCPGWSQSGGPWVKPEQAMRYLAATEKQLTGPGKFSEKLNPPTTHFEDVKVLAFPLQTAKWQNLFTLPGAKIVHSNNVSKPDVPKDRQSYTLPSGESYIGLVLPQTRTARSLAVYHTRYMYADCEFQVKENNTFRTVKQFTIDRRNPGFFLGFAPLSPVVISFPEVKSTEFRVVFHNSYSCGLADLSLTERYSEKSMGKMYQDASPEWDYYMWDTQTSDTSLSVNPAQVLDISSCLSSDGTITWYIPEGEWLIMRTGMAPTGVDNGPASPEGLGLEVDKMSKPHFAAHFDAYIGEIMRRIPAADRKTWKIIVADSYEKGGQNFTDGMIDEFRRIYAYDPTPFLPVFKGYPVGSPDRSDRFLWDVRRMVADKISSEYVGALTKVSNKHGFTSWLENYGHWGFPSEFLLYGKYADEVAGEFWSEGDHLIENRIASSCAHIYGKTKVAAESFTCVGKQYSRYPGEMKQLGDQSFSEGINHTVLHVSIEQPYDDLYPGVDSWFGNEFNRKNTWFDHLDLFTKYLKRCNFMLQQGLNIADAVYFIGEDAPKMTGITEPPMPKGYNFDYINADVILHDITVENGRLVLPHGTSYRVLVLPPQETMRPEVLQKIEKLTANGAVIIGTPPSRSPSMTNYPDADKQVRELAQKMWSDMSLTQRDYGKGKILTNMTMQEVFDLLNIPPDCGIAEDVLVRYTHRTLPQGDIYFIANQSDTTIEINPRFRVGGMKPELWDAVNGTIRPLPAFTQDETSTTVPMQLNSYESAFVVFKTKGETSASVASGLAANYLQPEKTIMVDTPWEVRFESDKIKRGPAEPVIFTQLQDWSKSEDERIRYFSGKAIYKTTLSTGISAHSRFVLDLGKVSVSAKIKINGKEAGGVWTAPYQTDITSFLNDGNNVIEIEVVNTWVNRIIGDLQLPENERKVKPYHNSWKAHSPLQKSGLLGPVTMKIIRN
jgi:hypothetical protein